MNILIVDDHKMFCDGLKLILQELDPSPDLHQAQDSRAAFESLRAHPDMDLIMLDINLPDQDGIMVLKQLAREYPTTPVIMLTATESRHMIRRSFDAGASGYVLKSSSAEIMLNAIRLVLSGGIYVPPTLVRGIQDESSLPSDASPGGARLDRLTPRQTEVLRQLKNGNSNKQIARSLALSESTVKSHVSAILSTLNLKSRVEAALLAQELDSNSI